MERKPTHKHRHVHSPGKEEPVDGSIIMNMTGHKVSRVNELLGQVAKLLLSSSSSSSSQWTLLKLSAADGQRNSSQQPDPSPISRQALQKRGSFCMYNDISADKYLHIFVH